MSIRPQRTARGAAFVNSERMRRLGLPLAAGVLVTLGTLMLTGGSDAATTANDAALVPTVVAAAPIAAGTDATDIVDRLDIVMLPDTARAQGAFESFDAISDGVVVADLVPGQQLLVTSLADDPIAAINDDYVAVSVRLDPQRWSGPFTTTGATVDLYATGDAGSQLVVTDARIVDAPDTTELDPRSEAVITLAVPANTVTAVIDAAADGTLWAVGA